MKTGEPSRRGRWAAALTLSAIGLVALGFLTAKVAKAYAVSSDDTTGLLEAASVLQGNVLLRDWAVSNVSFVATDLPFYVVGLAIRGWDPSLLRDVPSAIYAVAVGITIVLATSGVRSKGLAAAATVVLLGLPAGGLAEFVTKGYIRVGTSIGFFLGLIALAGPVGRKVSPARLVLYTTAVSLTLLSDTYMLVIGLIPVLVVCLLGAARRESYENLGIWRVAIATALAVPLAFGGTWLIRAVGGFESEPLPLMDYLSSKHPLQTLTANVRVLAENLPSMYRCDLPLGRGLVAWAVWLGCLIGPALLALALWWGCPTRRGRTRVDFAGDVLWMSMALGLSAFLVSANEKSRENLRYMVPFVLAGAVLTARMVGNRASGPRPILGALGVLAAAYGVTVAWDLAKPPADDPAIALAGWLEAHALRHGYAPYWEASIVTVSARGRVAVRPIRGRELSPGGRMVVEPFHWMTDKAWYHEGPVNFVVLRPGPSSKYHFQVVEHNCMAWFGWPSSKHPVGPYVVLVWNKDLRPLLVRDLPWAQ
jgi:hypothetical protein